MTRHCALCHHEQLFGQSRCLRKASWWAEPYKGDIGVIPVCTYHAKVWAASGAGDAWSLLTDDPVADLEVALQSPDRSPSAETPDVVASAPGVVATAAPGAS